MRIWCSLIYTVCEGVSCVSTVGVFCVLTYFDSVGQVHIYFLYRLIPWGAFFMCFLKHAGVVKLSRWLQVAQSCIPCLSLKQAPGVHKCSLSFARSLAALILATVCFFLTFTILITQFGQMNLECLVSSSQEMSMSNSRAMSVANLVVSEGMFLCFLCFFVVANWPQQRHISLRLFMWSS